MKDFYKSKNYTELKELLRDKLSLDDMRLFLDVILEAILYGMNQMRPKKGDL